MILTQPFVDIIGGIIVWAQISLDIADLYAREVVRGIQLSEWYRPSGIHYSSPEAELYGDFKYKSLARSKMSMRWHSRNQCIMNAQ